MNPSQGRPLRPPASCCPGRGDVGSCEAAGRLTFPVCKTIDAQCAPHSFFSMRRKERTRRARCKKEKGAPVSHAFLRSAVRGTGFASLAPLPGREVGETRIQRLRFLPTAPASEPSGRPGAVPCKGILPLVVFLGSVRTASFHERKEAVLELCPYSSARKSAQAAGPAARIVGREASKGRGEPSIRVQIPPASSTRSVPAA